MRRKWLTVSAILVMCLALTGCGEKDKETAAGVIDGVTSAIGNAIDHAPTGEQIIDGFDKFANAVGAGIDEYNKER